MWVLVINFPECFRHDLHQSYGTDMADRILIQTGLGNRLRLEPVPVEQRAEIALAVLLEVPIIFVGPFAGMDRVISDCVDRRNTKQGDEQNEESVDEYGLSALRVDLTEPQANDKAECDADADK